MQSNGSKVFIPNKKTSCVDTHGKKNLENQTTTPNSHLWKGFF